jgi:thioredoxin reductase (NADPH)
MATELIVVGAGLAGISAALWARSLEIEVIVLESGAAVGGQLHQVHFEPGNFAGAAGTGTGLARTLAAQLEAAAVPIRLGTLAAALEPRGPAVIVGRERIAARAVLVATGVRRRRLEVPGERELEGRGVSYSATQDRERFAGSPVLVVGGGDAAFENALILAEAGCAVSLAVRGAPTARGVFRARVAADRRVTVLDDTVVTAIEGDDRVRVVRLAAADGPRSLEVAGVVIKVGVEPNSEWCRTVLEHDPEGYLGVDAQLATSCPGVWAAGDVTRPPRLAMAIAAGDGARAVAAIRAHLRPDDP